MRLVLWSLVLLTAVNVATVGVNLFWITRITHNTAEYSERLLKTPDEEPVSTDISELQQEWIDENAPLLEVE